MGVLKTVSELLFPPRCVGCGQRLALDPQSKGTPPFCKKCTENWQRRTVAQCSQCNAPFFECECQPAIMKKAGSTMLLKVAPYDTELEMDPMVYAIRSIKQHPRGRAVECLAAEMVDILHKKLIVLDKKTPFSHTVIAHIPRSGKKVSRYGFDQARLLAKAVSKGTGIPFSPLLKRKKNTREQKTLTQRGRQENLRGAFFAKSDLRGARVILVDDVVTTGAGMAECTRVLRRSGAGQIVCLCAAMTPKRRREDDLHRYHTREST